MNTVLFYSQAAFRLLGINSELVGITSERSWCMVLKSYPKTATPLTFDMLVEAGLAEKRVQYRDFLLKGCKNFFQRWIMSFAFRALRDQGNEIPQWRLTEEGVKQWNEHKSKLIKSIF